MPNAKDESFKLSSICEEVLIFVMLISTIILFHHPDSDLISYPSKSYLT